MSEIEPGSCELTNENGKMGRRRFLVSASSVIGALGLDQFGRALRIDALKWGSRITEAEQNGISAGLSPGFIERGIESPFFTLKDGHGDWLNEAVKNPIINEVCHLVVEEMDSLPEGFSSIGHSFAFVCEASVLSLAKRYPAASKELLVSESIHVAVIAAAGVFSHCVDYADFGFDTTKWGGSAIMFDQRWGENGIGKKFPPLFPAVDSQEKFEIEGRDRGMHFFNHLLLAYELQYSSKTGGTAHLTTPLVMSLISDYVMSFAPEQASTAFSWIAGVGYEMMTTIAGREGFGDDQVEYDLVANQFGARMGHRLAQGDLAEVMKIMYDPRLIIDTDNPRQVLTTVLEDYDI